MCNTFTEALCIYLQNLTMYNKEPKESAELIDISDFRLCYLLYMMIFQYVMLLLLLLVLFNKQYWTKAIHIYAEYALCFNFHFVYVANCD